MEEQVGKVRELKEILNNEIKVKLDDDIEMAKDLMQLLGEINELDEDTTIKVTEWFDGSYTWEIVEEEKTLNDIIDDTKSEFTCGLSGVVYYGSDTQGVSVLSEREKEILMNYMSVFNDRLKQNINNFENKEEE